MFGFGEESPITVYITNNRVYLKALTPFGGQQTTVKMNNEWGTPIPANWDRNYDSNTFEMVDDHRLPVMQIHYINPYFVYVQGIFVAPDGAIINAFDWVGVTRPGDQMQISTNRNAWFKYPSTKYLGVRAEAL
jgi:hypothetical protein